MSGEYYVTLTVTDAKGNQATCQQIVRAYDWWYPGGGLNVSRTNRCLRYAVKPTQGVGWSFYDGADWIFPEARHAALKIIDENEKPVTLVWDATDGKPYRVDRDDIFTDKTTSYAGSEIECEVRFKEDRGEAEHYILEALEHHLHFRPHLETNKGSGGYTARGYRSAFAVEVSTLLDGEQSTPAARTQNIPIDGDITYDRNVEGHRQQLRAVMSASEWRLIRRRSYYVAKDQAGTPADRNMSEYGWQEALESPIFSLSRGTDKLLDLADGVSATGSYFVETSGPDGGTLTAMSFSGAESVTKDVSWLLDGDFTMMAWVAATSAAEIFTMLTGGSRFYVSAGPAINFFDGLNNHQVVVPNWNGMGWIHFAVVRTGAMLQFFINGISVSVEALTNYDSYGSRVTIMAGSSGSVFDPRIYNTAQNAESLLYYYLDVMDNQGNGVMYPL